MNIYKKELSLLRSSMLAWTGVLVLLILMFLTIYPQFTKDVETTRHLLGTLSAQIRDMVGLSIDNFFSFLGFYAYTFTYLTLAGAIQAMNLGLGMLSKESHSKTTDFLLTKPVTRSRIFIAKFAAVLTVIGITNIVLHTVTYMLANVFGVGDFDTNIFMLLAATFLLVQLWFVACGILVSQLVGRIKSTISWSLSIVFGLYIVGLLGSLLSDEDIRYFTPFKYFDLMKIIENASYEAVFVWLLINFIVMAISVSWRRYNTKDIPPAT